MNPDAIQFHIVRDKKIGNLKADFNKILDYLGTFGDIGISKDPEGAVTISYPETPLRAVLKTDSIHSVQDTVVSQQITLTCDRKDNLSISLLKNIVAVIGYRIFNPQTQSYLVNDPNLMDLTTIKLGRKVSRIFKKYGLSPLFNYRNSLVYFARNKKDGTIHLINRHLLDYFANDKGEITKQSGFSMKVAEDIGKFIALFDRGLIPTSFYPSYHGDTHIINMSGFDIDNFEDNLYVTTLFFEIDTANQDFQQIMGAHERLDTVKKHGDLKSYIKRLLESLKIKKRLIAIKISGDVNYVKTAKTKLIPRVTISVFLDES